MREEYREANKGIGWILLWVLAGIVFFGLIGAGIWGLNVAASPVKGAGDGYAEKNSAENWLDAQARFEENYADYESTLFKIETAATALEADPGNRTLEQNLQGTINYCASLVADYNADARNYLREDFKAADLPDKLDVDTCAVPTDN